MLKNMVAYEVALAGLMYAGSITIKAGCHDYHVGLMIDALSQLAAQPLGGKGAKGLGRYNLTAMINNEVVVSSVDGDITVDNCGDYMEALGEQLTDIDLDLLDSFFG
ncbi:hypothetical protein [Thiolapillus sp.]|uniref:hypothetical protein n=1 Tax=Thiolapillus sp. TaxID=2017437 RepID=UPI003AF92C6D